MKPVRIGHFRFYMLSDVKKLKRISKLQQMGLPLKTILAMIERLPLDGVVAEPPCVADAVEFQREKRVRRQKRKLP
jgi:DNA-binding transcriptional MerR regulator